MNMDYIGMPEAARRMGMSSSRAAKRALKNAGVPLVAINARALAVSVADLERFLASRSEYKGVGRPPGAKNKPKDG